jgi:outer membrane protein assembly factor BamB
MTALALALALAASPPQGMSSRLSPAPLELYRVAWMRPFVGPQALETSPLEPGGVGVDPQSGTAVFGTRDGWLHAVRLDGKVAWELRTEGGSWAPPAFDGDTVYAGSSDGRLYAIALSNGKLRWRYDAKEELGTRPVVADGTVFVMSLQDTLFAVDAKTGAWKWHHRREAKSGFSIRGAAWPAVRAGVVYAGYSDGFVAALETPSGKVRWERLVAPAGDYLDVDALELQGGRLYAAAFSGSVLCLDVSSGDVVWVFRAPGAVRLAADAGLVVAVTASTVYGLSPATGAPLWTAPLEGAPGSGEPVRVGQWILLPTGTAGLRFLDAATGRTVRTLDPGTGVSGTPGINAGRVYVLSNAGELLALDLP